MYNIKKSLVVFINYYGMKKDFYVFRHGETEYNRLGLRQGQGINVGLNEKGFHQAEELARLLDDVGIEVVYSSPLVRAIETAEKVAQRLSVPIKILSELTEGSFGDAEGLHRDIVHQRWPDVFAHWYNPTDMVDCGFPNGETKFEIQQRMLSAMEIMLQAPEKTIAVSSHGTALRCLLMRILYKGDKLPNAKAIHLVWEDGLWLLS